MAVVLKPGREVPTPASSDASTSVSNESTSTPASAAREVNGLAGFNLADLADEGRVRLLECRQQVVAMKAAAAAECKAIKESAEREGYEAGTRRAEQDFDKRVRAEAEKRSKSEIVAIKAAVGKMQQAYNRWMTDYAEVLNTTALSAAERLVQKSLGEDQEVFLRWASEALTSTRTAERLTLAVHPETLAELGQQLDELLTSPELPERTDVVPDETVGVGEISVRQTGGEIRAGLQSQLARLREMLG